jgi:hypothetical protein
MILVKPFLLFYVWHFVLSSSLDRLNFTICWISFFRCVPLLFFFLFHFFLFCFSFVFIYVCVCDFLAETCLASFRSPREAERESVEGYPCLDLIRITSTLFRLVRFPLSLSLSILLQANSSLVATTLSITFYCLFYLSLSLTLWW